LGKAALNSALRGCEKNPEHPVADVGTFGFQNEYLRKHLLTLKASPEGSQWSPGEATTGTVAIESPTTLEASQIASL